MPDKNRPSSDPATPFTRRPVASAANSRNAIEVSGELSYIPSEGNDGFASADLFSTILERIWYQLRHRYFPEKNELGDYIVEWSSRKQKRVLASCDLIGKRVRVARELARPEYVRFLSPLLYHEMCHAVIGREVETRNGARLWHGPEFKALEARHPESPLLQQWIRAGGWATAVRRDRAFAAAQQRKSRRTPASLR